MLTSNCLKAGCLVLVSLTPVQSLAELKKLSESTMSDISGQAMIAVDVTGTETQFTRITLGMDTEIQTNTRALQLASDDTGVDLGVDHLSLGHISTDGSEIQLDGQSYAADEIVPFEGINPYFEVAEVNGEVQGFRAGFGQARGTLSGTMSQFSGHIGLDVVDSSGAVVTATLFDKNTTPASRRATHIGIDDTSTDCSANVQCTALSNLETLDIGDRQDDGSVAFTRDFFLGFQAQSVDWQSTTGIVSAGPGVHFNVPTAMTLTVPELEAGVTRRRTEYIDRGLGLF